MGELLMTPDRERAIAVVRDALSDARYGHPDLDPLAVRVVDALLALPDPVRDAARELLLCHDDWARVVQDEQSLVAAHERETRAWDRLRAALKENP